MRYLRCCVFLLALTVTSAFAQTPAATPPASSSYQPAVIVRLIKALRADELSKSGFRSAIESLKDQDPKTAGLLQDFLNQVSSSEIVDRLIPIYTRFFSIDDAPVLAQFFESPAGIKIIDSALEKERRGKSAVLIPPKFTPSETAAVNAFSKTSASRGFAINLAMVNTEAAKMFRAWSEEFGRNKMKQAFAPLVKEADAMIDGTVGDQAAPGVSGMPAPGGGSGDVFNQVASVGVEYIKHLQVIAARYRKGVADLDAVGILKPTTLVSQTAIVESRQKVQRMGELLDQFLQSVDDAQKVYVAQADAIQLPEAARKSYKAGIENGLARGYSENIQFAEIEKSLIAQYGRMLDFAEARLGKISVVDNKLLFSDPADLQIYRELVAQFLSEAQQETALIKESSDRFKQSVQAYR
jgi:hypothetical protein